ncbi:MAG: spore maturation protein [Clostridia bacterium]|jgi:spore maturation protein B|nr:spore maturation protein [Clostridia bacterium]
MNTLSAAVMPIIVLIVTIFGLRKKRNLLNDFSEGAMKGLKIVVKILPVLIALMCASKIFCESGLADVSAQVFPANFPFPPKLVPLVFLKAFSSSAALGYASQIFKIFGPDSYEGMTASIMLGCTETIFYTMSIYFGSFGIKKTRYTFLCAAISTLSGVIVSAVIASYITGT